MSTDPAVVGRRVLAALGRGRELAISQKKQQAAGFVAAVRAEVDLDILRDMPARGRASRIAARLRGEHRRSVRQVQRVLDALFSASE